MTQNAPVQDWPLSFPHTQFRLNQQKSAEENLSLLRWVVGVPLEPTEEV